MVGIKFSPAAVLQLVSVCPQHELPHQRIKPLSVDITGVAEVALYEMMPTSPIIFGITLIMVYLYVRNVIRPFISYSYCGASKFDGMRAFSHLNSFCVFWFLVSPWETNDSQNQCYCFTFWSTSRYVRHVIFSKCSPMLWWGMYNNISAFSIIRTIELCNFTFTLRV